MDKVVFVHDLIKLLSICEDDEWVNSNINFFFHSKECKTLEEFHIRIVEITMLSNVLQKLPKKRKVIESIVQKQKDVTDEGLRTLLAANNISNIYSLYQKILRIETIEPDYFRISKISLEEKMKSVVSSDLKEKMENLIKELKEPFYYHIAEELQTKEKLELDIEGIMEELSLQQTPLNLFLFNAFNCIKKCYSEFDPAKSENKAFICGIDLPHLLISQNVARELLSYNENCVVAKAVGSKGTHAVCFKEGVFYKPNYDVNDDTPQYISPEKEFAIHSFYNLFGIADGIAATALLKIGNVIPKSGSIKEEVVQASEGVEGMPFDDFMYMIEILVFLEECVESKSKAKEIFLHLISNYDNIIQNFKEKHSELLEKEYQPVSFDEIQDTFKIDDNGLRTQAQDAIVSKVIDKFLIIIKEIFLNKDSKDGEDFYELDYLKKENLFKAGEALRGNATANFAKPNKYYDIFIEGMAILDKFPELSIRKYKNSSTEASDIVGMGILRGGAIKNILKLFPLDIYKPEEVYDEINSIWCKFDKKDLIMHFILSVLTNPRDHKTENFMLAFQKNSKGKIESFKLVGIDNDLALDVGENQVRTIVYHLPFMKERIPNSILSSFLLQFHPVQIIVDWICSLQAQNEKYLRMERLNIITPDDKIGITYYDHVSDKDVESIKLNIPLRVEWRLFTYIFEKLNNLYDFLQRNVNQSNLTCEIILENILPNVSQANKEAFCCNLPRFDEIYKCVNVGGDKSSQETYMGDLMEVASNFFKGNVPRDSTNIQQQNSQDGLIDSTDISDTRSTDRGKLFIIDELNDEYKLHVIEKLSQYFPSVGNNIKLPGEANNPESRKEIFFTAIKKGYSKCVARLYSEEQLVISVSSNSQEKKKSLIQLESSDDYKRTGLLWACYHLHYDIINFLYIFCHADPTKKDAAGRNAIYVVTRILPQAPQLGSSIIKLLASHPKVLWNQRCGESEKTPLHILIENACSERLITYAEPLINFMISKGSYPDWKSKDNETALDIAINRKNNQIIRQLIQLGAGKNLNYYQAKSYFTDNFQSMKETYHQLLSNSLYFRWIYTLNTFYNNYIIDLACSNKQKKTPLTVEFLLDTGENQGANRYTLIKNHCISRSFIDNIIETAQCLDEEGKDHIGEIKNNIANGVRRVLDFKIKLNDFDKEVTLFFKQDPESPGIEYAVNRLLFLLIGHGTSFSTVAKFSYSHSTFTKTKQYAVLISQGIEGKNLQDLIYDPADDDHSLEMQHELEKSLDRNAFSELFLASLLINYEDGKPDNFIVETKKSSGKNVIVCIDNDHAFLPPIAKKMDKAEKLEHGESNIVLVKCVLYCFNIMNEPIDPIAREKFLSLPIDSILREWLCDVQERNKLYSEFYDQTIVKKTGLSRIAQYMHMSSKTKGFESYDIKEKICPFRKGSILEIYQKFELIKIALKEPNITLMEILRIVIPVLGIRYEQTFKSHKSIYHRFFDIGRKSYKEALGGRFQTLLTSKRCLQHMEIPDFVEPDGNVASAIEELDQINKGIDGKTIKSIIQLLQKGKFDKFDELTANHKSKILSAFTFNRIATKTQLQILSHLCSGNYQSFKIRESEYFSEKHLQNLFTNSPSLFSLEITSCQSINAKFLKSVFRKAKQSIFHLSSLILENINHSPTMNFCMLPSLRKLSIINCKDVESIRFSNQLKYLTLHDCPRLKIVDAYEVDFVSQATKLETNEVIDQVGAVYKQQKEQKMILNQESNEENNEQQQQQQTPPSPSPINAKSSSSNNLKNSPQNSPGKGRHALHTSNPSITPGGGNGSGSNTPHNDHPNQQDEKEKILSRDNHFTLSKLSLKSLHSFPLSKMFSNYVNTHRMPNIILRNFPLYFNDIENEIFKPSSFNLKNILLFPSILQFFTFTKIDFSLCSSILKDDSLRSILQHCSHVININLSYCTHITKSSIYAICENCKNLEKLNLSSCNKITEDSIRILLDSKLPLKSLNLSLCSKISNKSLKYFSQSKIQLEKLNLSNCLITNEGLNYLNHHHKQNENLNSSNHEFYKSLKSLNLSSICDLPSDGLNQFLMTLYELNSNIEEINLSNCKLIDNSVLENISLFSKTLKKLNLSNCKLISDEGISKLLIHKQSRKNQKFTQLNSLHLCGLNKITQNGFCKLFENISNSLIELNLSNCKHFNENVLRSISSNNYNLNKLICSHCLHLKSSNQLNIIFQNFKKLNEIDVSHCNQITDEHLISFIANVPMHENKFLRILDKLKNKTSSLSNDDFRSLEKYQSKYIINSKDKNNNLKIINLNNCRKITDFGLFILFFGSPNLIKMNVKYCENVTNDCLLFLSRFCNSIKQLNLRYCTQIGDDGLKYLISNKNIKNITDLNLYNNNVTDAGIQCLILKNPNMIKLSLRYCKSISDSSLKMIADHCSKVSDINLRYCKTITDHGLKSLSQSCFQISKLNLDLCDKITDEGIQFISQNCTKLSKIVLTFCSLITDQSLHCLAKNCPQISFLDLTNCKSITSSGLIAISQNCSQISYLNLSKCSNIDNDGLQSVAENCSLISYLNIDDCKKVSDDGLIRFSNCRRIKRIYLQNCSLITDNTLFALSSSKLIEINLTGCCKITSKGVNAITSNSKALLTDISLDGCKHFDDNGLQVLYANCNRVSKISLDSTLVSDDHLEILATSCKKIISFSAKRCRNVTERGLRCFAHLQRVD